MDSGCPGMTGPRQIAVVAHGAWTEPHYFRLGPIQFEQISGDGFFRVPEGLSILFYSEHGEPGLSGVDELILKNPWQAFNGFRRGDAFNWAPTAGGGGAYSHIMGQDATRIEGHKIKLWNYQLSPRNDFIAAHQHGDYSRYGCDVDLIGIEHGTKRLSDVVAFFEQQKNAAGERYKVMHCCFCRTTYKSEDLQSDRAAAAAAETVVSGPLNVRPLPKPPSQDLSG